VRHGLSVVRRSLFAVRRKGSVNSIAENVRASDWRLATGGCYSFAAWNCLRLRGGWSISNQLLRMKLL
jgi:hypothetical protein